MFCRDSKSSYQASSSDRIPEFVLHELWKQKCLIGQALFDVDGEPIDILDIGQHNDHEGPDFLAGCIRFKDKIWHGAIEMHVKASDWILHGHQRDVNYSQVILHVVYECDQIILGHDAQPIPCIELKTLINEKLIDNLEKKNFSQQLPCDFFIEKMKWNKLFAQPEWLSLWMEQLYEARLRSKAQMFLDALTGGHFDWYRIGLAELLLGLLGPANKAVGQQFIEYLRFDIVHKNAAEFELLAAYLLGTAGFIDEKSNCKYALKFKQSYQFLSRKYKLQNPPKLAWHFKGVRPANFPSLRLLQWAMLIHSKPNLIHALLKCRNKKDMDELFGIQLPAYWHTHYVAGIKSKYHSTKIGRSTVYRLVINCVVPLQIAHHSSYRNADLNSRFQLLKTIPAERNAITRNWEKIGMKALNAAQSQALLHLAKSYCKPKRCLKCQIGLHCFSEI